MPLADALLSLLLGAPLWVMGTIVFDTVHWLLHCMLRSRWPALRALAWPHAVHHQWIDRQLQPIRSAVAPRVTSRALLARTQA